MSYGFDADRLLVWISARDPEAAPLGAGTLCLRHADAMVVPQGWTLDDRRESAPRLFRPGERVERPVATRTVRPRQRAAVVEAPLSLPGVEETDTTVADLAGRNEALDPDATVAIPWQPDFDEHDDLDGILAATSPLLARAFRGTERPR